MDHSQAPVLAALADYQRRKYIPFTPPGHKQARGADKRVVEVLGAAVFCSDIIATAGLDDRRSSKGILEYAQELMADAVGAEHTFFTTCGSSLSVKAAMLSIAGPHEQLLIGRDAHKSVVSGLILSGVQRSGWSHSGTQTSSWLIHRHRRHTRRRSSNIRMPEAPSSPHRPRTAPVPISALSSGCAITVDGR